MNKRIREVRKALGLTQEQFAKRLGVGRGVIMNIEYGRVEPKPPFVELLCRVFHVNEVWLRTGEGSMYREITRDEEISAFIETALSGESDSFKKRLLGVLSRLDESQWELLEQMAEALAAGKREPETK